MAEERWSAVATLCHIELALLVPALACVLLRVTRLREKVGELLVPPPRDRIVRARLALALPPLAVLVGCVVHAQAQSDAEATFDAFQPAFECLAVAVLIGWFSPWPSTSALGADGVQLGWRAWSYAELDGVRLEGASVELRAREETWTVHVNGDALERVRALLAPASAPEGA